MSETDDAELLENTIDEESGNVKSVIRSNNHFGKNLFKILSEENQKNIVISPFSAHCVLSMVYVGSQGDTSEEFEEILLLSDVQTTINEYHEILANIEKIKSVTFTAANKLYVMEKRTIRGDFRFILKSKFFAEAQNLNFAMTEEAAKTINDWVEEKTHNKIKGLIKPDMLDALTRLVLVNAIYFKGKWLHKFTSVEKEPFYLLDGSSKVIDMMHLNSTKLLYSEDETLNAKILQLPYQGKDIYMYVFLPNERDGVKYLGHALLDFDFVTCQQKMRQCEVDISLPKFNIEFDISLKSVLEEMGLSIIFTENAKFSRMSCNCRDLKVSDVVQKAFIEVNEEGTEAGAVTAAQTVKLSRPIRYIFKAEHPFVFTLNLRKDKNNPILFGQLLDI